ncbi:MAG TPA: YifB family Mg chelatase-like AAA ATPase [Bacteroidales bacterium]|nr:YifB family Mg chelatase-like AAA ATPase [Bacteroidales bacterium]
MLIKAYGSAVCGIEAITVTIEADVSAGINFYLVGLPDSAVRESQQRISTAVQAVGLRIPCKRIVINMAPADIRKEGSAYDLPLALAVLAASEQICTSVRNAPGQISHPVLESTVCMGELALDGTVRPVRGALSMALHARDCGFKACILPQESAREASVVEGIDVYGVSHLAQVLDLVEGFGGVEALKPVAAQNSGLPEAVHPHPDFSQVRGQVQARRALEVAAAGGHNVLMSGPPGAGKTFMARCLPGILPSLTPEEAVETTRIWSVAGMPRGEAGLMSIRPFRAPHHTASVMSLTGGGYSAMPGEISLAHNGVLYLDELPEFSGRALEVLRQPLEDGTIQLSRVRYKVSYPARFMLVASMNPCPCGFRGHPTKECVCTEYQVQRYRSRISGPLLDRIDIQLQVKPVEIDDLIPEQAEQFPIHAGQSLIQAGQSFIQAVTSAKQVRSSAGQVHSSAGQVHSYHAGMSGASAESSAVIRYRVEKAREIQRNRFCKLEGVHTNAHMKLDELNRYCELNGSCRTFLKQAALRMQFSARAHHRILRLARTIADLDGSVAIEIHHLAEAIQYR